jgi:hypothetical protein
MSTGESFNKDDGTLHLLVSLLDNWSQVLIAQGVHSSQIQNLPDLSNH